jgi:ribosomal protein S12 methylthiotransferase accessory factor
MTTAVRSGRRLRLRPPQRPAADWSAELARLLDTAADGDGAPLFGVEHEYRVVRGGVQVDFRETVHDLQLGVRGLDAADEHAYRLDSGSAVTADQRELEVATPPFAIEPGFTARLSAHVAADLVALRRRLGDSAGIDGYTTHLNVSVDPRDVDVAADLYARRFAPAMMLMLDEPRSPGLLVRPRAGGRLELCGYHVSPWRLPSVAAFAAGTALAAARAAASGDAAALPPPLAVAIAPAAIRHGHYVDRRACGPDLYAQGRRALLTTTAGARISAQLLLQEAWRVARAELAPLCGSDDLAAADAVVAGDLPLPCEASPGWTPRDAASAGLTSGVALPGAAGAGWAHLDQMRRRFGFELACVLSTWDVAVFVVLEDGTWRRAFACIPRRLLVAFLDALDGGRLDSVIAGYLRTPSQRRRLERHEQTQAPGLYDELGHRGELLPEERAPASLPVSVRVRDRSPGDVVGKAIVHGTHRACTADQTWDRVRPLLSTVGITRVADLTRLDVIGIPVFQAVRPLSRNLSVSQGKGLTPMLARVSAVMEGIETWHAEQVTLSATEAGIADVAPTLGYSPFRLSLATRHALAPSTRLHWVTATGVHTGRPGWVPREYVELDFTVAETWQPPLFRMSSNGLSSGNTAAEATLHGLCEVVERDSLARLNLVPVAQRRHVEPRSIGDGDVHTLLDMLRDAGVAFDIVDATGPTGVAAFAVQIWSADHVLVASGAGCHPDREVALCRALTEAAQSRLTLIAGARDDIDSRLYYGGTSVLPPGVPCTYTEIPTAVSDDIAADVERASRAVQDVTGVEPLVVDLSRDSVGIPVVRVVCPGMLGIVH